MLRGAILDNDLQIAVETVIETDRYTVWRAKEPDGELQYHLDVENVTLHFFQEEWNELLEMMATLLERGDRKDQKAPSAPRPGPESHPGQPPKRKR